MNGPDSRNRKPVEVECHDGYKHAHYPRRVKLDGIWYEIFEIRDRAVIEDFKSRERYYVYDCHIGDNITVKLIKDKNGWGRS